jgi:ADP-heptose:LPS heptosyltransferase
MSFVSKTAKALKETVFFVLRLSSCFSNKKSSLPDKREIKKILVIESGGIGDLLRVFPAIECLQTNFPGAEVSILASPSARGVFSFFPNREAALNVIDYDLKGRHRSFLKKLLLISALRKRRYDLIYAPGRGVGMREQAVISLMIGAHHRLGFREKEKGFLNTVEVEFRENVPILIQNLAILRAAGLEIHCGEIRSDVPQEDMAKAEKFLRGHDLYNSHPLISIHPVSVWSKGFLSWPLDKYISLIKMLLSELNAKVIIVGDKGESAGGEKIMGEIRSAAVVNAIGKTSISRTAALIKLSDIFIGNDSGPLHIAASLKKKSVGIFGPTLPEQVLAPFEGFIAVKKKLPCSPCYLHQHTFVPDCIEKQCMDIITPDEVMAAVRRLLL